MDNIVDRLRAAGKSAYDPTHVLMHDAAEEIERLRKALEQIRDDMLVDPKQVAIDALTQQDTRE